MDRFFNSLKTLLFGSAFILLWGWIASLVKYFDKFFGLELPRWFIFPGILLMITGGSLAFITALSFVIFGKGTPAPFDAPKEFVSVGPYKYVRNPMYTGGVALFEGFAFVNLSLSMIIFPFLWLLIVHLFVVHFEEVQLEKKFGNTYNDYKNRVNRWLPRFRLKIS